MNKQQEYLSQKRGGDFLPLNSFRRWHYAAALRAMGETVLSAETKIDLWKRVRDAGKPALDTLRRISAEHTAQRIANCLTPCPGRSLRN